MKWLILSVLGGLFVSGIGLFFYLGGNKPVEVLPIQSQTFYMLGKDHIGPYHKISNVIASVEAWAVKQNISCQKTFGQYMDDPKVVAEDRLKSFGGCLLTQEMTLSLPSEYKFKTVTHSKALVIKFEGSPAISPFKVYPKAFKWLAKHDHKLIASVIETYVVQSDNSVTTYYFFPIQ